MGRLRVDPKTRFASKWIEEDRGYDTPCWIWYGNVSGKYGRFWVSRNQGRVAAHRYSYAVKHGWIDPTLELDHLCRNKLCVNPDHTEPVSHSENILRGANKWRDATHCDAGHEFTEDNTRIRNDRGWKICRKCDAERARKYRKNAH